MESKEVGEFLMRENKYIKIIEEAIDNGHEKYGEIFQYMAHEYLNNTNHFSNTNPADNFADMFQAMDTYFVTDASKLDKDQLEYRQKVVDKFNSDRDEFGGEYDKMKHFIKGAYIGSNYGDTLGVAAGWGAEKVDSFKYLKGEVFEDRQSHQIGFSWKDYAYTKAGSRLGDYLSDLDSKDALLQMQNFSSGSLNLGIIYTPSGIKEGGVGKFDPLFSPFSKTTTDIVDDTIDTMIKNVNTTQPSNTLDQEVLEQRVDKQTHKTLDQTEVQDMQSNKPLDTTAKAEEHINKLFPHLQPTTNNEQSREQEEALSTNESQENYEVSPAFDTWLNENVNTSNEYSNDRGMEID